MMECPFCHSMNVDVPEVDIGVGSQQCGPASCLECGAAQGMDGKWRDASYWEELARSSGVEIVKKL